MCLVTDRWAAVVFVSVTVTVSDSVVGCVMVLCKMGAVQVEGDAVMHMFDIKVNLIYVFRVTANTLWRFYLLCID